MSSGSEWSRTNEFTSETDSSGLPAVPVSGNESAASDTDSSVRLAIARATNFVGTVGGMLANIAEPGINPATATAMAEGRRIRMTHITAMLMFNLKGCRLHKKLHPW